MVSASFGNVLDYSNLRRRFPPSDFGLTLTTVREVASAAGLSSRAVEAGTQNLRHVRAPAILHWRSNHFVVLKAFTRRRVSILDPSCGERTLSISEFNADYSGIALELWPSESFTRTTPKAVVRMRDIVGDVKGLRKSLAQILLIGLALQILSMASPFFLQLVVDLVLVSSDTALLTVLGLAFGLLLLLVEVVSAARTWFVTYLSTTLNIQWQSNVFTHLLALPVQYFETRHLGDTVSRFSAVETIQKAITTSLVTGAIDGVMASITLAVMFIYSPMLATFALAVMTIYLAMRALIYRPMRKATEETIASGAIQQTHFLESLRGIRTIKMFERFGTRREGWLDLMVRQVNSALRIQKLMLFIRLFNGVLFGLDNIAVIWIGASLVIGGKFSVGMLTAYLAYKAQFGTRVASLVDLYFDWKMLSVQAERLADIVHTKVEDAEGTHAVSGLRSVPDVAISLKDVAFKYPGSDVEILKDINLEIQPGECIAITGPSGCGKTTLLKVLVGFLPPTSGEIRFNGELMSAIGLRGIRSILGTVMQDDALFTGTIAQNIAFFDPNYERERVEECARLAMIHDEIEKFPSGYNSLVGDMGSMLSGGQRQRVQLARALYKQPRVLLLDEATSHLDLLAEGQIGQAVRRLKMTRIIVAHRPDTIAMADRVFKFDRGTLTAVDRPRIATVVGNMSAS